MTMTMGCSLFVFMHKTIQNKVAVFLTRKNLKYYKNNTYQTMYVRFLINMYLLILKKSAEINF